MKNEKFKNFLYFVSCLAPIIYILLDKIKNLLKEYYSKNFEMPLYVFFLSVLIPIVVSVLFFTKILFQKKMVSRSSKNLNILVTILLIMAIVLFYNTFNLLFFVSTYPMLTFIFCLQLCSLTYDLFLRDR